MTYGARHITSFTLGSEMNKDTFLAVANSCRDTPAGWCNVAVLLACQYMVLNPVEPVHADTWTAQKWKYSSFLLLRRNQIGIWSYGNLRIRQRCFELDIFQRGCIYIFLAGTVAQVNSVVSYCQSSPFQETATPTRTLRSTATSMESLSSSKPSQQHMPSSGSQSR